MTVLRELWNAFERCVSLGRIAKRMGRCKGNLEGVIVVRRCGSPQGDVKDIKKMLVGGQVRWLWGELRGVGEV